MTLLDILNETRLDNAIDVGLKASAYFRLGVGPMIDASWEEEL